MLRFQYGVDPDQLSDDLWAQLYQEWLYAGRVQMKAQAEHTKAVLKEVLYEIVNRLYGKKK